MKKCVLVVALLGVVSLSGCMAIPLVAGANMFQKGGTMTVTLEGKPSSKVAVEDFKKAVRADGGFVNTSTADQATASFKDVLVDLQMSAERTDQGLTRVIIQSSSGTNVARSYEVKDNIGDVPVKIAGEMAGFTIVDQKRAH